jgi:hypothetical protein
MDPRSGDEAARAKHENEGPVIVAIGASAGGIQVCTNLLAAMPIAPRRHIPVEKWRPQAPPRSALPIRAVTNFRR